MNDYCPDALDRRDPAFVARVLPPLEWFCAHYLRLQCTGLANIPTTGPVMFVANHNGGIMGPDLFCTLSVLWRTLGPAAPLYALAHDFAMRQLTPLGRLLQKVGAVAASPPNAERILRAGDPLLVYPGGDLDAYRHHRRRNEVVLLPRTGFVETARATGVPIVPIVAHGAHRSAYIFHEGAGIAAWLALHSRARVSRFPLAVALPWLIAPGPYLPYFPLPFRIRLEILAPVMVGRDEDAHAAAGRIQASMQASLSRMSHD